MHSFYTRVRTKLRRRQRTRLRALARAPERNCSSWANQCPKQQQARPVCCRRERQELPLHWGGKVTRQTAARRSRHIGRTCCSRYRRRCVRETRAHQAQQRCLPAGHTCRTRPCRTICVRRRCGLETVRARGSAAWCWRCTWAVGVMPRDAGDRNRR